MKEMKKRKQQKLWMRVREKIEEEKKTVQGDSQPSKTNIPQRQRICKYE